MKSREVHQFGPFRFDPAQYELRESDRRTTLPPALNKLLLLLVSRPGELVTREEIAATLWERQESVDVTSGINMAIKRLRTQIGDNNGHGVFIETVIGAGYRFVAPVSAFAVPEATVSPDPAAMGKDLDGGTLTDTRDIEEIVPAQPAAHFETAPAEVIAPPTGPVLVIKPSMTAGRAWLWLIGCLLLLSLGAAAWLFHSLRHSSEQSAGIDFAAQDGHPLTYDEPEDRLTAQAISPSGTYVVYADRAGLTLARLATGERRLLNVPANLTINHIAWFPDESSLLIDGFSQNADQTAAKPPRLWRVPLGAEPARLLLEDVTQAAVSPDGSRIAYLRGDGKEIWIADANGHSARKFLASPDRETFRFLLWSATGKVILADVHSRQPPPLAGSDLGTGAGDAGSHGDAEFLYLGYSADSAALLYQREGIGFDSAAMLRDGTLLFPINSPSGPASIAIARTDPSTGALLSAPRLIPSPRALRIAASNVAELTATSDGGLVSAVIDRSATSVFTADLLAGAGQSPRLLHEQRLTHHTGTTYPTGWLPDDSGVIFDDGIGGPIAINAQSIGSSEIHTLAETKSPAEKLAQGRLSPDGRWLIFLNLDRQSSRLNAIERVPIHGGTAEVVPTHGAVKDFRCSTSRAGRCVLREVEGKSFIVYYELDPVLGMGSELARTRWQPNFLGDWSVSPDGNIVARANHDGLHPAIELIALNRGSSGSSGLIPIRSIAVPGFGTILAPNWASDGRSFFVETYADPAYNLLSVQMDGRATLLRQSSELIWAVPSPDGKKIAFPGVNPFDRNVWAATLPGGAREARSLWTRSTPGSLQH